ncbi:MAG: hypothetical protein J7L73_07205 [Anaerolineales bacterium]|nr:hypothetical protein [Anaerolineales bacterium]
MITPSSIGSINKLPKSEKRQIYTRLIPKELLDTYKISDTLYDKQGNDLISMKCDPGTSTLELSLYHQYGFKDPILYGHITDTLTGYIHILLYILNDPFSPRFNVDVMKDGTPTKFGILQRNVEAEISAMKSGLAPGQIRKGPHLLPAAIKAFEAFVESLGHDRYFAEPLYYHNAINFERYGFAYQIGRHLMERIQEGFSNPGDLLPLLNGSSPFRMPEAANSIRLRSWAIHDGILGKPFTNVTMYKQIGKHAGFSTCQNCTW